MSQGLRYTQNGTIEAMQLPKAAKSQDFLLT
jgi:hypothetical protein